MLGTGTSITHGAILICADCNCTINWVGGSGLIYYATGANPTSTNKNVIQQIKMRSLNQLEIIRRKFAKRTMNIDPKTITLDNMFGIEGDNVKKI